MEPREASERAKCGLGGATNGKVSDETGRMGDKHGGSGVGGKGLVVGAFTNALVSSTRSHIMHIFYRSFVNLSAPTGK